MAQLSIRSKRELNDQVDYAACAKKGCLTWQEFLDYFFLRNATYEDRIDGNDWWNKLDQNGKPIVEKSPRDQTESVNLDDESLDGSKEHTHSRYAKMSRGARLLQEFKPVTMTPALEYLMKTRKDKVNFDVDEDFKNMQQDTQATSGNMDMMKTSLSKKKGTGFSAAADVD